MFRFTTIKDYHTNLQSGQTTVVEAVRFFVEAAKGGAALNAWLTIYEDEALQAAKKFGFDITIHADQFTTSGSEVAVQIGAISADHLEASGDKEIELVAQSNTIAVALPGASVGLGCPFAPARKILDKGGALAIASDWNPGSAPMGDLVCQASILATFEKLTTAEVFAGITFRAAAALNLFDRGRLIAGNKADFILYPSTDYRDILYYQGSLRPSQVWKSGKLVGV